MHDLPNADLPTAPDQPDEVADLSIPDAPIDSDPPTPVAPVAPDPEPAQARAAAVEAPSDAPLNAQFTVPITVELDQLVVPLADLQAIREGSVIPLDAEGATLPVRLLAGGRPFARGVLVSVGDGYGVLIEAE